MTTAAIPLYRQIKDDIKHQIDIGKLNEGDKIPSVNDITQSYSVSSITAVRVFKELNRDNYVRYEKGKGYFVTNYQEKASPEKLHGLIGCFIRPLRDIRRGDNYYNDINYGIQSESCSRKINLLRSHSLGVLNQYVPSEEGLAEIKRSMLNIADNVDGFLIDERIPDSLAGDVADKTGKPMVIVNRRSTLKLDTVGPDNTRGVMDALEKALRMGYETFIFCSTGSKDSCFYERKRAFKEFIKKNNIDDKRAGIINNCSINSRDESLAAIKKMYDENSGGTKTLIMAEMDSVGRDLVNFLPATGIKILENAGIIGYGGFGYATNFKPRLATVDIDSIGIGSMAVKVLMEHVSSEKYWEPAYHSPEAVFSFGETI